MQRQRVEQEVDQPRCEAAVAAEIAEKERKEADAAASERECKHGGSGRQRHRGAERGGERQAVDDTGVGARVGVL